MSHSFPAGIARRALNVLRIGRETGLLEQRRQPRQKGRDFQRIEHRLLDEQLRRTRRHERGVVLDHPLDSLPIRKLRGAERAGRKDSRSPAPTSGFLSHRALLPGGNPPFGRCLEKTLT